MTLHNHCAPQVKPECNLGEFRDHILPPTCICPMVLERQKSVNSTTSGPKRGITKSESNTLSELNPNAQASTQQGVSPVSFQITPERGTHPLVVLINPKSGGRQGQR